MHEVCKLPPTEDSINLLLISEIGDRVWYAQIRGTCDLLLIDAVALHLQSAEIVIHTVAMWEQGWLIVNNSFFS